MQLQAVLGYGGHVHAGVHRLGYYGHGGGLAVIRPAEAGKYLEHPEILQILKQHHVALVAGGYGAYVAQAVGAGGVVACHLYRLYRVHAALYGHAGYAVYVALTANVLDVFVVRAEHHVVRWQTVLYYLGYELLHAVGGGAYPQEYSHADAELFKHLVKVAALVIRGGAGHPVSIQCAAGKQRRVAVYGATVKETELIHHVL